jgi:hypothetical protein
LQKYSKNEGK